MFEITCSFPQFGMYRALTIASAAEMCWLGEHIYPRVAGYFEDHHIGCLPEEQLDFGVTFSTRMMLAEQAPLLHTAGFDFADFCQSIEQDVRSLESDELAVSLAGVRIGDCGIGLTFAHPQPAATELLMQRNTLRAAAMRAKGQALRIRNPAHVTLLNWARGTGRPLTANERADLRSLVDTERLRLGVGSICLSRLVLGMGYTRPWTRPFLPFRIKDKLALAA